MIPKHFGVFVGKDPFYSAFNGDMKNFRFAVGPGAYRENNFDELYKVKDQACNDDVLAQPYGKCCIMYSKCDYKGD